MNGTASNSVAGAVTALTGVATLVVAAAMPAARTLAADASLLPRAVGVGLVVTGLGILVLALTGRARPDDDAFDGGEGIPIELPVEVPDELRREPEDARPAGRETALFLVVTGGYCVAAFTLDYVVATVAFLLVTPLLLGYGRTGPQRWWLGLSAVGVAALIHVGLFVLLGVRAPAGLLL